MSNFHYDPTIFDAADLVRAKSIVLTNEDGISTDVRWKFETPWLVDLIKKYAPPDTLIVDYGCGVGRISSCLVDQGHKVIGVDTSSFMRQHATEQINSDRFIAIPPDDLDSYISASTQVDTVVAIWVLQHCFDLEAVVGRIQQILKPGGILAISDMQHRAVPTNKGWVHDGKSVKAELLKKFSLVNELPYAPPMAPANLRQNAYVAFFRKDV